MKRPNNATSKKKQSQCYEPVYVQGVVIMKEQLLKNTDLFIHE